MHELARAGSQPHDDARHMILLTGAKKRVWESARRDSLAL